MISLYKYRKLKKFSTENNSVLQCFFSFQQETAIGFIFNRYLSVFLVEYCLEEYIQQDVIMWVQNICKMSKFTFPSKFYFRLN